MTFAPAITLSRALSDPSLFGGTFGASSFWTWRVLAKIIDGIALTEPREIELFEQCTGRSYSRLARRGVRRIFILVGRRGGKDRFLSPIAVWRAALCINWRKWQSAGEGAVVILLGADKKQAAILRRYCQGLLEAPLLAREVVRQTADIIEFKNGSSLEIAANDVRLVRGRSAIAVLGSECAHWKTDEHAASSDEEVVAAAEPSMAMCPDAGLLVMGSSVYRKRGFMHRMYKELHGNDTAEDIVWFAPSQVMNPRLRSGDIDRALARDAAKARAEFQNIWREDLSDFIPLDAIENCTDFDVHERPPLPGIRYFAFADTAGGTGSDSFALAIAHYDRSRDLIIIDAVREYKPRFVPRLVIAELAKLLQAYGVASVMSDRFAGGFSSDEWTRNSVRFLACARNTSENYLFALPLLLAGRVRLVDGTTLRSQLSSLERHVMANTEVVRHPAVASVHDDLATATCGAIVMVQRAAQRPRVPLSPPTLFSTATERSFNWATTNPTRRPVGVPTRHYTMRAASAGRRFQAKCERMLVSVYQRRRPPTRALAGILKGARQ
jgi:hypothetical protein